MATNSHGTSNTDDDPTSELPALPESEVVKQAPDPDAIPVLTDVTESLPVLTDILHPGPAPDAERPPQAPSDSAATTDAASRTAVGDRRGNELQRRVEEQESLLREAIDQLDRVKEQAAWVRDALLSEQRDRSRLAEQVSELLGQRAGGRPQGDGTGESDDASPPPSPTGNRNRDRNWNRHRSRQLDQSRSRSRKHGLSLIRCLIRCLSRNWPWTRRWPTRSRR